MREKGLRVVFTNGCFDILHYGHIKYLEDAKKKGDILIVALNTDALVKRIKGNLRPVVPQQDRAKVIAALESVDFVVFFNEDTPLKTIKTLKPDILIKGGDWDTKKIVGFDVVTGYGGKVLTIPYIKGRSTTSLIQKIVKTYAS